MRKRLEVGKNHGNTNYDESALLEQEIIRLSSAGWHVVSRTASGAQLRKPKQWNRSLLILGLLLLVVFGTGVIFLIIALIHYVLQKEQLIYITPQSIRAQHRQPISHSAWRGPITVAIAIILIIAFMLMAVWILNILAS